MTAVILQPSYLPWRGYFHLMGRADVFVHYDDVQYTRQDWRSRNRIRVPGGTEWLTIPVENAGFLTNRLMIKDARVHWGRQWNRSHRDKIVRSYARTPHFARYFPVIDEILSAHEELLVAYTIPLVERLAAALGIIRRGSCARRSSASRTKIPPSASSASARTSARTAISPGPARRTISTKRASRARASRSSTWSTAIRRTSRSTTLFEPAVSVIDLLFMTGEQAPDYIWGERTRD